jgi:hypothetical protein
MGLLALSKPPYFQMLLNQELLKSMNSLTTQPSDDSSLEGKSYYPDNQILIEKVIDLAFDYRGDVTIDLEPEGSVVGYVFSRNVSAAHPFLEMFIEGNSTPRKIEYKKVRAIHFSGEDTALGKSWDAWVKKKEEDNKTSSASTS